MTGSATDDEFTSFVLEWGAGASPSNSDWHTIAIGSSPVSHGALGTWATGSMTGVYTVRLTVTDAASNFNPATASTVYVDNADRGSEPYYTKVPFDLKGGWTAGVNVATGEATLGRTLFSIPGVGPADTISLSYNSNDTRPNDPLGSPFGPGWSSNVTQYLDVSARSDGFVVWHRADGAEVPFGLVNGAFVALAGHYEKLADLGNGDGYRITFTDRSALRFDSSGYLAATIDAYGKAMTVAWKTPAQCGTTSRCATITAASDPRVTTITFDGSRISSVIDSAGRQWHFAYATSTFKVTDPLGNDTEFYYALSGRVEGIVRSLSRFYPDASTSVDPFGWFISYDASNRVAEVGDPIQGGVRREADEIRLWRRLVCLAGDNCNVTRRRPLGYGCVRNPIPNESQRSGLGGKRRSSGPFGVPSLRGYASAARRSACPS